MKIETGQSRSGLARADWRLDDGSGNKTVPSQPASSLLGTPGGRRPRLQRMLNPKVVAVIGATETPGSVGRALMENLRSFGQNLYPVNPKRPGVLGVKASHELLMFQPQSIW